MGEQLIIQGLMRAGAHFVALTMLTLVLFSIYSLAVIGERWWTFRKARLASGGLVRKVTERVERGEVAAAQAVCEQRGGSPVGAVLAAGLKEMGAAFSSNPGLRAGSLLDRQAAAAREAMQRATAGEIERLERGLTSLATLGNISPFVGLFGTVIGVMRAFEAISQAGSGGIGTVSAGIAEALVATAAGLFVAIPAVAAYNSFVSRVKSMATEMDGAASELLGVVQRLAFAESREAGSAAQ
jgi:biopolymer transport protein ExbB/biopolymer transport protein TolQ